MVSLAPLTTALSFAGSAHGTMAFFALVFPFPTKSTFPMIACLRICLPSGSILAASLDVTSCHLRSQRFRKHHTTVDLAHGLRHSKPSLTSPTQAVTNLLS